MQLVTQTSPGSLKSVDERISIHFLVTLSLNVTILKHMHSFMQNYLPLLQYVAPQLQ